MIPIKDKIKDSIVYISKDPMRALGLETLLPNFYIISYEDSYILNFIKNVYSIKREKSTQEQRGDITSILSDTRVKDYISNIPNPTFMFFKPNFGGEKLLNNSKILNTTYSLNKKFEDKIELVKLFGEMIPRSNIINLETENYNSLKNFFGSKFVIQFSHGHSGNTTFFISSEEEFNNLKEEYPKRISKAVQFVEGEYFTVNGVVTKRGIVTGNLSKQITGVKNLTDFAGSTVGNDWNTKLENRVKEKIKLLTQNVGNILQTYGYLGMFGIDLIFDGSSIFLIEINPRENASMPVFTQVQIENGYIPFKLIHILEFLNIDYVLDIKKENDFIFQDIQLTNLVIRKKDNQNNKISFNGVYNSNLEKIREGYNISSLKDNNEILILSKNEIGNTNEEIGRIQKRGNISPEEIDFIIDNI